MLVVWCHIVLCVSLFSKLLAKMMMMIYVCVIKKMMICLCMYCVYMYICVYMVVPMYVICYLLDHINYVGCLVELLKEIIFFFVWFWQYELLDEMMDFGYPQYTEAKILSEFIKTDAYRMEVTQRPPMAVTNAVSWRSEGIRYKKNEVSYFLLIS